LAALVPRTLFASDPCGSYRLLLGAKSGWARWINPWKAQLAPLFEDPPDRLTMLLDDEAAYEEGGLHAQPPQQAQDPRQANLYPVEPPVT